MREAIDTDSEAEEYREVTGIDRRTGEKILVKVPLSRSKFKPHIMEHFDRRFYFTNFEGRPDKVVDMSGKFSRYR